MYEITRTRLQCLCSIYQLRWHKMCLYELILIGNSFLARKCLGVILDAELHDPPATAVWLQSAQILSSSLSAVSAQQQLLHKSQGQTTPKRLSKRNSTYPQGDRRCATSQLPDGWSTNIPNIWQGLLTEPSPLHYEIKSKVMICCVAIATLEA